MRRQTIVLALLICAVGGVVFFGVGNWREAPGSLSDDNADDVVIFDIETTDGAEDSEGVRRELTGYHVRGRVIDSAGNGLSGALVNVETSEEVSSVTTLMDGSFILGPLPVDNPAKIKISANGFIPDSIKVDENEHEVLVALLRTGRIEGKAVEHQSTRAVERFSVSLFVNQDLARTNAPDVRVAFDDESGFFAISDLEPKRTDLLARADGYQPVAIRDIDVGSQTDVVELNFVEARVISGRVVGASSGKAISEAAVSVIGPQAYLDLPRPIPFPLPGQSTKTSADGTFTLDELTKEDVTLYVRAENYAPRRIDVGSFSAGTIEILMTPGASVAGQLIGIEGNNPQAGSIRLIDLETGGYHHNLTNDAGQFLYRNKPPGDYVLLATTSVGQSDRIDVTLKEGEHLNGLRIQIRAGIELTGHVSGLMSGEAVLGVSTTLPGSHSVSEKTDAAGNYALRGLPTGNLRIVASTTSGRSLSKSIELQADSATYLDFVFDGTARIHGRITRGGVPASNTSIEMVPVSDDNPRGRVITSSDGYYEIKGLANAKYAFRIRGNGNRYVTMNGSTQLDIDL